MGNQTKIRRRITLELIVESYYEEDLELEYIKDDLVESLIDADNHYTFVGIQVDEEP